MVAKINGAAYQELIEQQYSPQMNTPAHKAGKAKKWHFQQENAPARKTQPATVAIKKNSNRFQGWPAASPDLSVIGDYIFNELQQVIEKMDAPPKTEAVLRTAVGLVCASLAQQKINAAIDGLAKRGKKCAEETGVRFERNL